MTPPGSPSALLERAAERLAELAEKATPGPWSLYGIGDYGWSVTGPDGSPETADTEQGRADAEWIAAMSPAVAQPLVEWLRDAARRMEFHPHLSPEGSTMQRTALAFARQVLGEPLNHDWFFPYDSHPGARECSRCGAHDDSQLCD